jgi:pyroglutamyl-peptidase
VPDAAPRPRAVRPLRLLLSGFEPFGGEPVNPAERLVRALARGSAPDARVRLAVVVLPVDRTRFRAQFDRAVSRYRPDALIAVGQATGRPAVDLETRARNRLDYRGERDNGGHAAEDEALAEGAPELLRASLPLGALQRDLLRQGLPVRVSRDAGRHLCNALLYHVLLRHPSLPAGFVHVPLLPAQAARRGRGEAHLGEQVSRRCLEALIRALAERLAGCPARHPSLHPALPAACRRPRAAPKGVRTGPLPPRGRSARRSVVPRAARAGGLRARSAAPPGAG